jgi:hypothetical protein
MTHDCLLCGAHGPQVRPRMVEWKDPIGSKRFELLTVCSDVKECRSRVELREEWPLVETSREAA